MLLPPYPISMLSDTWALGMKFKTLPSFGKPLVILAYVRITQTWQMLATLSSIIQQKILTTLKDLPHLLMATALINLASALLHSQTMSSCSLTAPTTKWLTLTTTATLWSTTATPSLEPTLAFYHVKLTPATNFTTSLSHVVKNCFPATISPS